jgi:hypothetical protein
MEKQWSEQFKFSVDELEIYCMNNELDKIWQYVVMVILWQYLIASMDWTSQDTSIRANNLRVKFGTLDV